MTVTGRLAGGDRRAARGPGRLRGRPRCRCGCWRNWRRNSPRGSSWSPPAAGSRSCGGSRTPSELAAIARGLEARRRGLALERWSRGSPAAREREVARATEARIRELGGDPSFPAIVAAGPNGALPHAEPGEREIGRGELVVFDMGAKLDGYCSDGTRTFATGDPGEEGARGLRGRARRRSGGAGGDPRRGQAARTSTRVARKVIDDAGHGEHFGHGLGHGVGLEVHEGPRALAALRRRPRARRSRHGRARRLPAGQARGADRGPGRRHRGRPAQPQLAAERAADRRLSSRRQASGSPCISNLKPMPFGRARRCPAMPRQDRPATRWSRSTRKRGANACSTWRSACAATASPASRSSPWPSPSAAAASAGGGWCRCSARPRRLRGRRPLHAQQQPTRRSGSPAPGRRCRRCSALRSSSPAAPPARSWSGSPCRRSPSASASSRAGWSSAPSTCSPSSSPRRRRPRPARGLGAAPGR